MVGYPSVVHVEVPVLVTVTKPVMVPAAPCPWLGAPDILLQAGIATELDVVETTDDVVDEEVVVAW
jgi:hypothetical protein